MSEHETRPAKHGHCSFYQPDFSQMRGERERGVCLHKDGPCYFVFSDTAPSLVCPIPPAPAEWESLARRERG